ncbi:MAG TPA: arginine--tRNA ligase [Armatimonadota bacterium]|jgi:arginyl-tRNA synthetase
MPTRRFQQLLLDHVRTVFPQLEEVPEQMLTVPPDPAMGDLCLQTFPLAKALKQGPPQIAAQLDAGAAELPGFARVEQKGPYLNFFYDPQALAAAVLDEVRAQGDNYGSSTQGSGQTVVIDYSSPNIAKPFGIGHLRSTVIGGALYRLYQAAGYHVVGINHLGDWGTQFGLLLCAFEEVGDEAALEADPVEYCYRLYVEYSRKREADETLAERARQWFKRLEDGDPAAVALWSKIRELSLLEFQRVYARLGVSFDYLRGESYYNGLLEQTLERVRAAGLLREDQGALIVDLAPLDLPPAMLAKSDGASTYLLRDLAAVLSRAEEFHFTRCLYVIGTPQALHMQQLKLVLGKLGVPWAEGVTHINFGHILGMKTREGNLIFLSDVLDEAAQRSRTKIEENQERGWTDADADVDAISQAVGIGAIIFNDLRQNRTHEITFDWERMLNFEGDSGPYLQYAYSRTCGILRKGESAVMPDADLAIFAEASDQDRALLVALGNFATAVEHAVVEDAPHHLCQYLLELSTVFSRWYTNHQVLGSGEWQEARLALVHAVRQALGNGLRLLGMSALERM